MFLPVAALGGGDAATSEGCAQETITFDGIAPLNYAAVTGETGTRAYLYQHYPEACSPKAGDKCKSAAHVVPGDVVAIGKTCASWAYVQYLGEKAMTLGWIAADRLGAFGQTVPPAEPPSRYQFALIKGKGIPVCEAYLQRLNRSDFKKKDGFRPEASPPYCGRPEDDSVPGFSTLHRVQVTAQEVNRLTASIWNFTHPNVRFSECEVRGADSSVCVPTWPLKNTEKELSFELYVWGYSPQIDVENNGSPDNVIVWQGQGAGTSGGLCGEVGLRYSPDAGLRQSQIAYILTPDGRHLDEGRTKAIFGHPFQSYTVKESDGYERVFRNSYRPIGTSMGIFEYRNVFYIDTFFDVWGDLENKRRDQPDLGNRLAVILRKGGIARQVCEYEVSGQDYPRGATWTLNP